MSVKHLRILRAVLPLQIAELSADHVALAHQPPQAGRFLLARRFHPHDVVGAQVHVRHPAVHQLIHGPILDDRLFVVAFAADDGDCRQLLIGFWSARGRQRLLQRDLPCRQAVHTGPLHAGHVVLAGFRSRLRAGGDR